MKCHRCPKVATLHITEIVKGAAHELHLCEECAQQYLNRPSEETDAGAAVGGALIKPGTEADEQLEELDKLICPTCKLTFKDFRSQGRLGCSHCYIAFHDELMPLLENIHGETQHCGKFPKRTPDDSQKQYQLIKLRNDLRQAVVDESYEEAAKLRDEIQKLEADVSKK